MKKTEILDSLVAAGNGYLTTSQVVASGISKPTLAEYVRKNNMERVAQGVYLAENAWEDALYQLYLLNTKIVFSHETALYLHGLMEHEPNAICATVRAGYNATHLRKRGVHVFQVKPGIYELGAAAVQTAFGNTVRTYDMDRTICDIIRNKDNMDVQVFRYAMKEYMAGDKKNLNHLMGYAKRLQVDDAVRTYTEVML